MIALPQLSNSIKVVKTNYSVKDTESRSMEVCFPMNLLDNRKVFGNANRMGVTGWIQTFDNCCLLNENRLIIEGRGTITEVTDEMVKLQIKEKRASRELPSAFYTTFIDEIDLSNVDETAYYWVKKGSPRSLSDYNALVCQQDVIFPVIYDETNDIFLNVPQITVNPVKSNVYGDPEYDQGNPTVSVRVADASPQPSLDVVLSAILSHFGYTSDKLLEQAFGELGKAYVCNTHRFTDGGDLKKSLPHWRVSRFLEELEKLYNMKFRIENGRVLIEKKVEKNMQTVSYQTMEDFSSQYNEDGFENIKVSHVAYNLSESSSRLCDDLKEDVLNVFRKSEYRTETEMINAWNSMNDQQRMTTIFHTPYGWHYTRKDYSGRAYLVRCLFQHLHRDNADSMVELNAVPVAIASNKWTMHIDARDSYYTWHVRSETREIEEYVPSCLQEERAVSYVSVQDAAETGASIEKSESERMELMFLSDFLHEHPIHLDYEYYVDEGRSILIDEYISVFTPAVGTDRLCVPSMIDVPSFAFGSTQSPSYIGQLHQQQKLFDDHRQYIFKFLTDDIPDPFNVYIFNGKQYICEKTEIEITDLGISPVKTGYFYETVS